MRRMGGVRERELRGLHAVCVDVSCGAPLPRHPFSSPPPPPLLLLLLPIRTPPQRLLLAHAG
eukprot:3939273-Rhodomonas_salina.1